MDKVQEWLWSAGKIRILLSDVNLSHPLLKTCKSDPRSQDTWKYKFFIGNTYISSVLPYLCYTYFWICQKILKKFSTKPPFDDINSINCAFSTWLLIKRLLTTSIRPEVRFPLMHQDTMFKNCKKWNMLILAFAIYNWAVNCVLLHYFCSFSKQCVPETGRKCRLWWCLTFNKSSGLMRGRRTVG